MATELLSPDSNLGRSEVVLGALSAGTSLTLATVRGCPWSWPSAHAPSNARARTVFTALFVILTSSVLSAQDWSLSRSTRWSRRKACLVIRHVSAGMLLTAFCEKSFVALLHNRQWHLALLFAHFAAMFEFGGNHMPVLDTPEFNQKILSVSTNEDHPGFFFF